MTSLRDSYLDRTPDGDPLAAAALLARDLMEDDPVSFKQGYSLDNAALAAADYMQVGHNRVRAALQEAARRDYQRSCLHASIDGNARCLRCGAWCG